MNDGCINRLYSIVLKDSFKISKILQTIKFYDQRLCDKIFSPNYWFTSTESFNFADLKTVDVAQLVRALDCGSRGRGFESHLPPPSHPVPKGTGFFYAR